MQTKITKWLKCRVFITQCTCEVYWEQGAARHAWLLHQQSSENPFQQILQTRHFQKGQRSVVLRWVALLLLWYSISHRSSRAEDCLWLERSLAPQLTTPSTSATCWIEVMSSKNITTTTRRQVNLKTSGPGSESYRIHQYSGNQPWELLSHHCILWKVERRNRPIAVPASTFDQEYQQPV